MNRPYESHPFQPFLPERARILFLGSFPPSANRWCMDFYYPNYTNDFWRVMGILFYDDKGYFMVPGERKFDASRIVEFLRDRGIALYDTAEKVIRMRDNASDKFLEIIQQTNIRSILEHIPQCLTVVTTGLKAAEVVSAQTSTALPATGKFVEFALNGNTYRHYRMPSTSRAYPVAVEKKAEIYRIVFPELHA